MTVDARIHLLRTEMRNANIHAYILPSSDPHNSEYAPDRWKSREWISGFTGSAGTSVVTLKESGLWADSRYFLQAEDELAQSEMVLHKMFNQFKPQYIEWLCENLNSGDTVAVDGNLFSIGAIQSFEKMLSEYDIQLNTQLDLIELVWGDRPKIPSNKIFEHEVQYAGKSRIEKINSIRQEMNNHGADAHLISTLDDIAWTFNLRGTDVEYNPVFVSYAVIKHNESILFMDEPKIPSELLNTLNEENIVIKPYSEIISYLNNLNENESILVDKRNCNVSLYRSINSKKIILGTTIPRNLKAIKNDIEIEHTRNVMVKDGVALCKAFYWLEQTLEKESVKEISFSDKLAEYRSQQNGYKGESFGAIIGYQDNGAVIHYRPNQESSKNIEKNGMLLCDSGGQYVDGTTDITRTITLSSPSAEHKTNFTLVLKGMIALTMAKFPKGTKGGQLDILARQFLWNNGLNYLHGTGHGVGFFLNVHEPTQGFSSPGNERGDTVHVPGMISSNEPGYYKDGAYGIRIENLIVCKEASNGYLFFETLTLMPIDLNLVDKSLLTESEINWLNAYHEKVYEKLSVHLTSEENQWLVEKTKSI